MTKFGIKFIENLNKIDEDFEFYWEYFEFGRIKIGYFSFYRITGKQNCELIKKASLSDWQIIATTLYHNLYSKTLDKHEKNNVFYLLSCTENPLAFETFVYFIQYLIFVVCFFK